MSVPRWILERLSRNLVFRRRLPRRLGGQLLWVTPDASLRFWRPGLGHADPLLLQWAAEWVEEGCVVWDIGANVGLFAFASAHQAGPRGTVLAVEADDRLSALIHRSAAAAPSGSAPVEVLTAAVSDHCGVERFGVAERSRATSHLLSKRGSSQTGGTREVRVVITLTLDWLLGRFPAPSLVKLDVEGAEAACLRGATELLSQVRPVVFCEVAHENAVAVAEIFRRHRYVLLDAALPRGEQRPLDLPAWNTLALPDGACSHEP
jgi:FkbM family methyltransferase